ncbi:TonB-dependent siderophore receptor [Dysgonomonas sp. 25]|uniref:TonB-dependent siderophore receptor n=1 Tax=Dysgonomonas sp. 25 TaxID=2302933 RepID=UPI00351B5584
MAQSLIKGRVVDEKGEPMVGALVVLEGTQKGVHTDDDGRFRFHHLDRKAYDVKVTFVGYQTVVKKADLTNKYEEILTIQMVSDNNLHEVEVFGERYKQPEKLDAITRMPLRPNEQIQSISVISEKVIVEQGALSISDAMRNVPGVTLFGSYGGVKESMSTRGFRGVPVLKNGVRMDSQFQTASGITDMQGVESIQMIKGSAAITQGVITDIGNAGGVIDVVTKTPKFTNAAEVGVRVGSWGQFRPTFDVQTVLDESKKTALRINGAYERSDNYRPIVRMERVYINPSFEWRPNDKTTVNLEADYLNEDRTPVTSTVNLAADSVRALYDMPHNKFLGFRNDNTNTELMTYSARIKHYFNQNFSIRAALYGSSYQVDNTSTGLSTPNANKPGADYNIRNRTLSRSLRDDNNYTFQFDFVGQDVYTGPVKHTFQAGFDYRKADATTKNLGSFVIDQIDVTLPASQIPNSRVDTLFYNENDYSKVKPVNTKYNTYGVMAQEVMSITKYARAILAIRYSSITTNSNSGTKGSEAGPVRNDAWDPMFGLMLSPVENVNFFGSYTTSTNLRSAADLLVGGGTAGASKTKQWETGFKTEWFDHRLRFNFTYFHIITENLTNSEYNGTQATGLKYKAGDLKRDGIEVELNGRILDNLQVMLGYAYLDARYANSPSYKNGSAPMNAPKHTANGWIYYTQDKGILKDLSVGVGAYYVGERPVNEHSLRPDGHGSMIGAKPFDMPGYITWNAQLAYRYKHITARAYFNNIFDKVGYNSYYRGGYINQIDPRNFAGSLSYTF